MKDPCLQPVESPVNKADTSPRLLLYMKMTDQSFCHERSARLSSFDGLRADCSCIPSLESQIA
jgi:hypothetical protein